MLNTPWQDVSTIEDVKADSAFAIVTPDECLELATSLGPQSELVFHPLIGGTPPDIAWRGLRAFADDVLPSLRRMGYV